MFTKFKIIQIFHPVFKFWKGSKLREHNFFILFLLSTPKFVFRDYGYFNRDAYTLMWVFGKNLHSVLYYY